MKLVYRILRRSADWDNFEVVDKLFDSLLDAEFYLFDTYGETPESNVIAMNNNLLVIEEVEEEGSSKTVLMKEVVYNRYHNVPACLTGSDLEEYLENRSADEIIVEERTTYDEYTQNGLFISNTQGSGKMVLSIELNEDTANRLWDQAQGGFLFDEGMEEAFDVLDGNLEKSFPEKKNDGTYMYFFDRLADALLFKAYLSALNFPVVILEDEDGDPYRDTETPFVILTTKPF